MLEVLEKLLRQVFLEVQAVFVSEEVTSLGIGELLMVRNCHVDPVVFMSPRSRICKNLRFAATSWTPEQYASVVAAIALNPCCSLVDWLPMVIAELVVPLQDQFVLDSVELLHITQLTQIGLVEVQD